MLAMLWAVRKMKTACIISNGCTRNLLDDSLFRDYFKKNGCLLVGRPEEADIILFNTCAYCKDKENECLTSMDKLDSVRKKGSQVIIAGCLPSIKPSIKRRYQYKFIGPRNLNELDGITGFKNKMCMMPNNHINTSPLAGKKKIIAYIKCKVKPLARKLIEKNPALERVFFVGYDQYGYDPSMFYINVSIGCLNNCSYCVIKLAKGNLKSKPVNDVLKEFKRGLSEGYTRFMLIAEDIGCYGRDLKTNLAYLLREMFKTQGSYKVCFSNFHARWMISSLANLLPLLKTGKIDVICLPVQSGSNRILSMMSRGYTIEQFEKIMRTIRKEVPNLVIKTHVMVGFPSESEEDFNQTTKFLEETDLDEIIVLKYSDMEFAKSYLIKEKTNEDIKEERRTIIEKLAKRKRKRTKLKILFNALKGMPD